MRCQVRNIYVALSIEQCTVTACDETENNFVKKSGERQKTPLTHRITIGRDGYLPVELLMGRNLPFTVLVTPGDIKLVIIDELEQRLPSVTIYEIG